MKYLLDTNTCVRFINGRVPQLRVKLLAADQDDMAVCSVVKAEMYFGAMKSQMPTISLQKQRRFLDQFVSLPFDDVAAEHYGNIRAALEKNGTPIGGNDTLIAAIARAHNLILVTHNTKEFSRVVGLTLEDWEV